MVLQLLFEVDRIVFGPAYIPQQTFGPAEKFMAEHVINNTSPLAQSRGSAVVPSICVFDVNETLLDIEFIAPLFKRLFGDSWVMRPS